MGSLGKDAEDKKKKKKSWVGGKNKEIDNTVTLKQQIEEEKWTKSYQDIQYSALWQKSDIYSGKIM